MKKLFCATFEGIDALSVSVESTLTKGLPTFNIVGMANTAITESKERVKSALLSNGFTFPPKRITINLSPSDLKKEGSQFDLGIALLIALDPTEATVDTWYVFGELGLDGSVKENTLLYPLILSLANQGLLERVIVPRESLKKLTRIPGVAFHGVSHLNEAIALLRDGVPDEPLQPIQESHPFPSLDINDVAYYYQQDYPADFKDVKGQEIAKRAALICAAGMHNLLLEGSPGCGKSMIAKRLQYILPPLSGHQLLDIAKLQCLEGMEPHFAPLRPFRSPHHTSTAASIFGGGSHRAQIGEVGLAHHGILFFDELPHFSKPVLEAMREPLEDKKIRISRVNAKVEYPTEFLFIAAMNPCPCGNLLNPAKSCRCSERELKRYKNRLSDPFLDRIDLYVQMQPVTGGDKTGVGSSQMHDQVLASHRRQLARGQTAPNGRLCDSEVDRFCRLDAEANGILEQATNRFALSFRSIKKVLKVSRTIADIDSAEQIGKRHLLEALSYRRRTP